MIVRELFRRLSYGALSNLAISGAGSGDITDAKKPQIVVYVNEALRMIYSRFLLSEKTLAIRLDEGRTRYHLHPEHASTYDSEGFILDSGTDPFTGDLIKVLRVVDSWGKDLPLNNPDNAKSVFTPEPTLLEVPFPIQDDVIYLNYQAMPRDVFENEIEDEIPVPRLLEDAVVSYVAYCVYRDMNSQDSTAKAQEHLGRYEIICVENDENDLLSNSSAGAEQKFEQEGWV